jgi:hypothetical protein
MTSAWQNSKEFGGIQMNSKKLEELSKKINKLIPNSYILAIRYEESLETRRNDLKEDIEKEFHIFITGINVEK